MQFRLKDFFHYCELCVRVMNRLIDPLSLLNNAVFNL